MAAPEPLHSMLESHSRTVQSAAAFWTLREKSTTGQPWVMQPRETMSTCGEKYMGRFSVVTPPLASISSDGNSCFSAAAAVCRSWCGEQTQGRQCYLMRSDNVEMYREKGNKNSAQTWCVFNLRVKVVQHDNVCSRSGRFSGLLCWAALHLHLAAEATHTASLFNGLKSKEWIGINKHTRREDFINFSRNYTLNIYYICILFTLTLSSTALFFYIYFCRSGIFIISLRTLSGTISPVLSYTGKSKLWPGGLIRLVKIFNLARWTWSYH